MENSEILYGSPTGYTYVFSSNQNNQTDFLKGSKVRNKKEYVAGANHENEANTPEMQLLKEILEVLRQLNLHSISLHYEFELLGMARMEKNKTEDLWLCKKEEDSDWTFLRCETGRALVGRPGVVTVSVLEKVQPSVADTADLNTGLSSVAQGIGLEEKVYLEVDFHSPKEGFTENYELLPLASLQERMMKNGEADHPSFGKILQKNDARLEILQEIEKLITAIFKKANSTPQEEKAYLALAEKVEELKERVWQLSS